MLRVNVSVLGMMSTNCYLVYDDEETPDENGLRQAVIVDAAAQPERIFSACEELKVRPAAILLTHGHFDHIGAVDAVREKYGIDAYILDREQDVLADPALNLSSMFEGELRISGVKSVSDGQKLQLIGHAFQVIATPGHTHGGCCYYVADSGVLFSGDTLFYESYGKFTFPTGSMRDIVVSIVERLMPLPPETKVFPGHDRATTIANEQAHNICNVIYQKNKEAGKL